MHCLYNKDQIGLQLLCRTGGVLFFFFFVCVCCCFFCCCFNISYESKWKKRNCYWPTQGELHTKINSNRVASTWVTFNVIWNGWLPLWGCYSEWHWLIQTVLRICVKIASIFSLLSRWKFKDIIFFINLVILLFFLLPKGPVLSSAESTYWAP